MSTPAPSPSHILRNHTAAINSLSFSADNELLYSGDASGTVVVTLTRLLRSLASWAAHTDGILGVQEWGAHIITHARDNKMHVWSLIHDPRFIRGAGPAATETSTPELLYSMDVNALNYCRFSLLPSSQTEAMIAFPNLVDSSLADVWSLPSRERIHASVGSQGSAYASDGRGKDQTGIIMSMHLFKATTPTSNNEERLHLLCGYENGRAILRCYSRTEKEKSVQNAGWDTLWDVKLHVESIMSMTISPDCSFGLSVSADHLVGRYAITPNRNIDKKTLDHVAHRTKHPGNAAIAIKADSKICAIGGWDGKVRLYSTRTLRPLGTLAYHKTACQVVAFAHEPAEVAANSAEDGSAEEDEDEMTPEEKEKRQRWVAAGGKDGRISIWSLMRFEKT